MRRQKQARADRPNARAMGDIALHVPTFVTLKIKDLATLDLDELLGAQKNTPDLNQKLS
jgi:hypothetical protein